MDALEEPTTSTSVDKGKRRAVDEATETTPLLAGSASTSEEPSTPTNSSSSVRLSRTLLNVFLGTLLLCIIAFIIVALLAFSYASRVADKSPDDILHQAVVFDGPSKINVLNTTWAEGVWVDVHGRLGVDAGSVIGVNRDRYGNDGFLHNIWKSLGRWGIEELRQVSVETSKINITSHDGSIILATLETPPLEVPLTVDPPSDLSWLSHFTLPVLVRPTHDIDAIIRFCREAWKLGHVAVRADVADLDIRGGSLYSRSWRSMLHREFSKFSTLVKVKIPVLPGFPQPGRNTPLPPISELITLRNFSLYSKTDRLWVDAVATVPDPLPVNFIKMVVPDLPFTISLPSSPSTSVTIASVNTKPFSLTHPNITLEISGHVPPLASEVLPLLSTFITRYMSGLPNPIVISTPLVPDLTVDASFPGPIEKPRILRDVTIHDMKIKPGNTFLASGTVYARVVLPKGMNVEIDVKKVFPDLLVFDGDVPDLQSRTLTPLPPSRPLPDPLPEKAFGHIRPDEWLVSRSAAVEPEDGDGATFSVTAKFADVPLEVLEGRQREFSDFVGKVIFGREGAIAGILGEASVGVIVQGLPVNGSEMVLSGLPFRGSVRVGKKGLLTDYWTHIAGHEWTGLFHT